MIRPAAVLIEAGKSEHQMDYKIQALQGVAEGQK
jgi:hypothetical protein